MSKLKEQFSELRKNTPKRVQWLLLAAAFVVVLILLTLLLSGGDKKAETETDSVPVALKITPDMVNWPDVVVGTQKTQKIKVSANAPAKIVKLERNIEVPGLRVETACPNVGAVSDKVACEITIKYSPSAVMQTEQVPVFIHWHAEGESETMLRKDTKIVLTLGAVAPKATEKPQPKVEKKPEPVVVPEPEPEPEPEPVIIKQEIKKEIETIAPAVSFDEPVRPAAAPAQKPAEKSYEIPDGCSDFAFPGYNSSGTQIGWIKPQGGAYKFYPFSDKECKNPTGTYNPDNGIITDSKGKKIGTDADHIGYATIANGVLPELGNAPTKRTVNRARQLDDVSNILSGGMSSLGAIGTDTSIVKKKEFEAETYLGSAAGADRVLSSRPYDRSFILRQYKPIPATIVSEVRADPEALKNNKLPVRATVDRNVYSDNGRNVIIPTGTLLLGYVTGELPGPYTSIGRMDIKWYQFILPNGIEFNFEDDEKSPFSGDAQGRSGIPGYGSTDYMEQFIMPMLTAIVPAAVNLIAPVSDAFVNQIDLDNNTVVQSGTVRSSELAKNEIITAWNQVAQKLMVDMMDNTVPPFSIAAGTRITVYSPVDLVASCGESGDGKKCSLGYADTNRRSNWSHTTQKTNDASWIGQVRSFAIANCCTNDGKVVDGYESDEKCNIYDYRTLVFYCQANQYEAINSAKQKAVYENQQSTDNKNSIASITSQGTKTYNEQVLGLTYDEETGAIQNPFNAPKEEVVEETIITCEDGNAPDANGCCAGEIYTDMGDQGFNCCPEAGGDCFPPIL